MKIRVFFLVSHCVSALLFVHSGLAQRFASTDSLESLLAGATRAFSSGDFATAAELLQRLERDFGGESIFQEPSFLRRVLPLKGMAELQSGAPGQAVETLSAFLDRFPGEVGYSPHLLYSLATAHRQNNEPLEALRRFEEFAANNPDPTRFALATLQRAEILIGLERSAEAFNLLDHFSQSNAPPTLIAQGRLFAASEAIREDRLEIAAKFLLQAEQGLAGVPEIAVLSFTAIDLGDRLVEAGDAATAIRIYRLALSRPLLVEEQNRRIDTLVAALAPHSAPLEGAWSSYLQTLLGRMRDQLFLLRRMEDYTASLTLRRGQALLMAERHREAWLLFESLAMDASLPDGLRGDAHYRWILAAGGLEQWEEALAVARNFTLRYPGSDLASTAFYLIAQAHRERHRYAEAIEVLSDLIEHFPEHPLHPRWLFERGLSHTFLEQFPFARSDFISARDQNEDGNIGANANFWHALTHFFEGNFATALEEWDHLAEISHGHPLEGEILYRRAATLYAARDLDRGLDETRNFIRRFPRHSRYGEARLLEGEILAGSGKPQEALLAYRQVPSEREALFVHAVFQGGTILRSLNEYAAVVLHFSAYIEKDPEAIPARISEALYWVGWAHTRLDEPEKARRLFRETLEIHGDRRDAREIQSVLETLARLGNGENTKGIFDNWLETQRKNAIEDERFTWFARLTLHLAQAEEEKNPSKRSEELLFEIARKVSPERLDAACLGAVGHALLESDPLSAENLFNRLLEDFPASPERADAYFGLGALALERGDPGRALSWLRRINESLPAHRRAPEAALLAGKAAMQTKDYPAAGALFESVLAMRSARGRLHAVALTGMAEAFEGQGQPDRSIAAYQRITTLYRAYPGLLAEAYFQSGRLLDKRGDPAAAYRTFSEMLQMPTLADSPFFQLAEEEKERLETQMPVPAEESR